ncbi:MAG: adenosine kinase [Alphaproteobacteria bacterium]
MTEEALDVILIGNAIVDVIAAVDDAFIEAEGAPKGGMTLIDAGQADAVYSRMGPAKESSGGSAANTAAGIASFGGKAGFIGRVRDDQLGQIFGHDIRGAGVAFDTPAATAGMSTARCFVFVTPDAERTMMTFLGASTEITPDDVSPKALSGAGMLYIEGYLWDAPPAKAAVLKAIEATKATGGCVAFSLSDSFCVHRHREEFRDLIAKHVDVLFANEDEVVALYETDDFDAAATAAAGEVAIAALTRGAAGSVAVAGGERVVVPAEPVDKVLDTTGAGDLYAAGFLFGLSQGRPLDDCARLGGLAAAEVISHYGARPERSLADIARSKSL